MMDYINKVMVRIRGDLKSVELILGAFKTFFEPTDLSMNPSKCTIFCGGMEASSIKEVKNFSGFEEGLLPVKYLEVPVGRVRIAPTYKHMFMPYIVRCETLNTPPHAQD
ncbi:unnamed protein product [Lathyrus sativus]|nr:unnamed protein product [Lathyrus sativus]